MTSTTGERAHPYTSSRDRPRLSLLALGSGVLVALAGTGLFGGVAVAVLDSVGDLGRELSPPATLWERTLVAGAVVAVPMVGHLWAGYTAGRMARRRGVLHGALIPVLVVLAGLAAFAVVDGPWARSGGVHAFVEGSRFPLVVGLAVAAAALIGGAVGGWLGVRWHRRLERRTQG